MYIHFNLKYQKYDKIRKIIEGTSFNLKSSKWDKMWKRNKNVHICQFEICKIIIEWEKNKCIHIFQIDDFKISPVLKIYISSNFKRGKCKKEKKYAYIGNKKNKIKWEK